MLLIIHFLDYIYNIKKELITNSMSSCKIFQSSMHLFSQSQWIHNSILKSQRLIQSSGINKSSKVSYTSILKVEENFICISASILIKIYEICCWEIHTKFFILHLFRTATRISSGPLNQKHNSQPYLKTITTIIKILSLLQ